MSRRKAAFVFAHPGHEMSINSRIAEEDGDILYLTDSDVGEEKNRTKITEAVLIGMQQEGEITRFGVSERVSFQSALHKDKIFFLRLKERVRKWLLDRQPTVVYSDAFEQYNFHHDLSSLIVSSILSEGSLSCLHMEVPLAIYGEPQTASLSNAEVVKSYPRTLQCVRLSKENAEAKYTRFEVLATQSKYFAPLLEIFAKERFMVEFLLEGTTYPNYFERIDGPWKHYDEWGKMRVKAGRYESALTFTEHFLPLVDVMFSKNQRAVA